MFGYIKADLNKLDENNTALYRTAYCSLCFALKKHYGIFSRYLLNYDVTFLALLELNYEKEESHETLKYCPYKMKKSACIQNEEVFFYCASVLMILTYEKILDNIRDEFFFKKLFYLFLKLVFHRKYLKAKKAFPLLCEGIHANMLSQIKAETGGASVDRAAHPTADSLGKIFAFRHQNRTLYQFGYMLGRWIYFMDAADDRQKDIKTGSFNPFLSRYGNEEIQKILNLSIGEAVEAYYGLPRGNYSPLMENIIIEGTNTAQERVFKGDTQ